MTVDANSIHREHGTDALREAFDKASDPFADAVQTEPLAESFDPEPYAFPDPATIPRRKYLFGRHYIRGAVGATIGAPGRLKSTTVLTEFIGMACGRDLLTGESLEAPLISMERKTRRNSTDGWRRSCSDMASAARIAVLAYGCCPHASSQLGWQFRDRKAAPWWRKMS